MNVNASASDLVRDLKQRVGATATALVARDGAVLHADLPGGTYAETFAIMCATIFGAASTANTELARGVPDRVVIEGADSRTLIVRTGPGPLLVAVVDLGIEPVFALGELLKFASLVDTRPGP
jgi:uncharacterized protein